LVREVGSFVAEPLTAPNLCYIAYLLSDTATKNDVNDDADAASTVTSTTDHMTMSFMMGKTPVRLELDKNDNIPPLSSYYTAENGKLIQWTLDEEQVIKLLTFIDCN